MSRGLCLMFLVFGGSRCRGEVHEVGRHAVCLAGSYPLRSYVADRGLLCFELLRLNYSSTTLASPLDELVIRIRLVILTSHHRQASRKPAVRYSSSYTVSTAHKFQSSSSQHISLQTITQSIKYNAQNILDAAITRPYTCAGAEPAPTN